MSRHSDLDRLYELFDQLEANVGGKQQLKDCTGYMDWPDRAYISFSQKMRRGTRLTSSGSHVSEHTLFRWDCRHHCGTASEHTEEQRGTYEDGGDY
jgi:hypothetical protein